MQSTLATGARRLLALSPTLRHSHPHAKSVFTTNTINTSNPMNNNLDTPGSLSDLANRASPAGEVLKSTVLHKHFLTLRCVQVKHSDGRVLDWDVIGQPKQNPAFATVFPYNTKTKTTTLLVEYAQGTNEFKYTFVAGGFEPHKHTSIEETALKELSEEARLTTSRLVRLLPDGHEGVAELKWAATKFVPFIALDPCVDTDPQPRDAEETIEIYRDVPLDKVEEIILQGNMMLPAVQTYFMAKSYLQKNNLL